MHRLLQGDVGAGKTAVALAALLQCLRHGLPAAFMAFLAAGRATPPNPDRPPWRSPRTSLHRIARQRSVGPPTAAAGPCRLFGVGTQPLLSEHLGLQDAGLVVVDEQHRFGVRQRALLRRAEVRTPTSW